MQLKIYIPMLPNPMIFESLHRALQAKNPRAQQGLYAALSGAKAQLRQITRHSTQMALLGKGNAQKDHSKTFPRPLFAGGLLEMDFVFRKRANFRDVNNCIGAAKAAIDGLQDAGLIKDDTSLQIGHVGRFTAGSRKRDQKETLKEGMYFYYDSNPPVLRHVQTGSGKCPTCGQMIEEPG